MPAVAEETIVHSPSRHQTGYAAPIQGAAYICSVAPIPRFAHREHNVVVEVEEKGRMVPRIGLGIDYMLPAAPRGSYRVLVVYDTFQALRNLNEFREQLTVTLEPRPIPASVVANDLLSQWVSSVVGGSYNVYPGIGIIGRDTPTEDELSRLRAINSTWCEWCVNDASEHEGKGEWNKIHKIHRLAAEWLYDTGAHQFKWYKERRQQDLKECLACLTQIPSRAAVCPSCRVNLVDFCVEYGATPDEFIADMVTRRMERLTKPGA